MTHNPKNPPATATDEPAVPSTPEHRPALPLCAVSDRLTRELIESAAEAGRDVRAGRATRVDGWTPERIRKFLEYLAECGVVEDAARAVEMTGRSAYYLRSRTTNRAFHIAWTAAEYIARNRLIGDLMSRAIHGCREVIIRNGEVWGERHRYDNRHSMAMLTRLDQKVLANDEESRVARMVAQEFDQFVEIVSAGGNGAAEFISHRKQVDAGWRPLAEEELLERSGNFRRYGVGHPDEVDISDLESSNPEDWTEEQAERAARCGLVENDDEDGNDGEEDDEENDKAEGSGRPPGFSPGAWAAMQRDEAENRTRHAAPVEVSETVAAANAEEPTESSAACNPAEPPQSDADADADSAAPAPQTAPEPVDKAADQVSAEAPASQEPEHYPGWVATEPRWQPDGNPELH